MVQRDAGHGGDFRGDDVGESSRPPRPVSITAISTFWSAKYAKLMAVKISKKVGRSRRHAPQNRLQPLDVFHHGRLRDHFPG